MQRGLVYPTRLTSRLKSLILIKEVLFTHAAAGPSHLPTPVDELELEYIDLCL
ncbi:hypothetical protein M405DRAFT_939068 [Rhizopogon salebrosus TDB-379]|nr:hypothetical protein M405DRAFT_939068 [Rhizopogon salebrosus TDB-379]